MQPVSPMMALGLVLMRVWIWPLTLSSPFCLTEQVMKMTKSAWFWWGILVPPEALRREEILWESAMFIWQPRVWRWKVKGGLRFIWVIFERDFGEMILTDEGKCVWDWFWKHLEKVQKKLDKFDRM